VKLTKALEAQMPTKQQRRDKRRVAAQRANLGQKEAELEKLGKEQMSHMEGGKGSKPGQRRPTKRGAR
jgi:hypothetical protein